MVLAQCAGWLLCEITKFDDSICVHEVAMVVGGGGSAQARVMDAAKRAAVDVLADTMHLPGLNDADAEATRRRAVRVQTHEAAARAAWGARAPADIAVGHAYTADAGAYGPQDADSVWTKSSDMAQVCQAALSMDHTRYLQRHECNEEGEVVVAYMEKGGGATETRAYAMGADGAATGGGEEYGDDPAARLHHDLDGTITGLRSKIKGKLGRTPEKQCHEEHGHIPFRKDCKTCLSNMGVFKNKSRHRVDGFIDRRPCYAFHGDTITFDTRSRQGNKYLFGLTDGAGFIAAFCLGAKSELTGALDRWLTKMRADPRFNHHEYPFCVELHLDCAGEQEHKNAGFQAMLRTHDPTPRTVYGDPQQLSSHALQENLMQRMELTVKSLLKQTASPAEDWENVVPQMVLLRIIVPHKRDEMEAGTTGDVITPLERATCGRCDRKEQERWYKNFAGFGTVALTKRPAKQSKVDGQRYKVGIVKGFVPGNPDLIEFFCPMRGQGTTWVTKSFILVHRSPDVTYEEFLGVAPAPPSKRALPRIGDDEINKRLMVVRIEGIEQWAAEEGINVRGAPREANRKVSARNMAKPQVTFVDGNNEQWAPCDEGKLENRGPLLARLNVEGWVKPPVGAVGPDVEEMKVADQRLAELDSDPLACVRRGDTFYRRFDTGLFKGRVTKFHKTQAVWTVKYDLADEHSAPADNTTEDFEKEDMRVYVYVGVDRPRTHITMQPEPTVADGGTTAMGPAAPAMGVGNPYEVQVGEPEPIWLRSVVSGMPTVVTEAEDTFPIVCCKLQKLGFLKGEDEHTWYYEYLGKCYGHEAKNTEESELVLGVEFFKPYNRSGREVRNQTKLEAGITFPAPAGARWEMLLGRKKVQSGSRVHHQDTMIHDLLSEGKRAARAYSAARRQRETDEPEWVQRARWQGMSSYGCAKARRASDDDEATMEQACPGIFKAAMDRAMAVAVRKVGTEWPAWDLSAYIVNGRVEAPASIKEARLRPDWPRWRNAIEVEYGSIDDMEVMIHKVTLKEAADKYKITHRPIQLKTLLDVKYLSDGKTIGKYKCRRIVAAHPGAVEEGVHFTETWAPAPNTAATRVMQAYALLHGWKVKCWDICVAFLHSQLDPAEYVLLKYEPEHRSKNESGEDHYAVLVRGLYGLKQSPALFYKTLTEFMFERLNTGGWSCRRSAMDPCFFILRGPHGATKSTDGSVHEPGGAQGATDVERESVAKAAARAGIDMGVCDDRTVLMVVHVDDIDAVGGNEQNLQELRDLMHERFGVKDCDAREMLGVRREWSADGKYLEMTMKGFIEHTVERFKGYFSETKRDIPFPAGEMLVRGQVSVAESQRVLDRGLRELCGCLLWAWRMAMPLLGPGINQICKMMSAPCERTWDCAIWLLEFAFQHRDRGIRFCREGNRVPHAFYDSGGAPDPTDMKSQHGHLVYLAGGPAMHTTKKHRHEPASGTMG